MRDIRDSGKVIGTDRIAVMAALNITHELLEQGPRPGTSQKGQEKSGDNVNQRLRGLQNKIEDALFKTRQLEI